MAVLTDLDAVARFLDDAAPRTRVARSEGFVRATLPDDAGTLTIEWSPGAPMHVRLPVAVVAESRVGAVMELLSEINATLGVLGFVLHRAEGIVEFRTTIFPDDSGHISTQVFSRVVTTIEDSVAHVSPRLQETAREDAVQVPSWWTE